MITALNHNIDSPRSRYLVFTSAGNNANLHCWLKGDRNFDIWVCYYGDDKYLYKENSDYYIARKGGKFPNLHYVYHHWKDILDKYQAIMVMDDDIIINGSAISRLFEIRQQYDMWLIQPSFNPLGKISHPITAVKPFSFMRYTNFVEVSVPLFRKDKLDDFMKIYEPELVGWGIDWWYMDALGPDLKEKVAIVDVVSCINPHNWEKGGQREIDLLQDPNARIRNWERIKAQYNIRSSEGGTREFDCIRSPLSASDVTHALVIYLNLIILKWKRKIKSLTRRFV